MNLDIRLPTGLLFLIIGLMMLIYGAVTHFTAPEMYDRSLGINVNLWWGLAQIVFAAAMLGLAFRRKAKMQQP